MGVLVFDICPCVLVSMCHVSSSVHQCRALCSGGFHCISAAISVECVLALCKFGTSIRACACVRSLAVLASLNSRVRLFGITGTIQRRGKSHCG